MSTASKTCPDCRSPLQAVKMLDSTATWRGNEPAGFFELRYTTPESTEGLFSGMPNCGLVKGWICPQCNRILLYGQPEAD
jgi:hypothetical protein